MTLSEMEDWDFSCAWVAMPSEEKAALPSVDRKFYVERYRALTSYMDHETARHKKGNGEYCPPSQPVEDERPEGELFVNASDFISDITPPEWLVDGIIQRSYLYGLTAQTNHGKTALAAHIAVCVALGRSFGNQSCEPGHVLFLAGENPEDFKLRLRGAVQANGIKAIDIDGRITVMPCSGELITFVTKIKEFSELHPLALILVDTSVAYFSYRDENANVDARMHAQDLRMLIKSNGTPAVVALCHPIKNANQENLVPRGGSAFQFELDCNLTLWKEGEVMELHHNKLRGPSFQPIQFRLAQCVLAGVLDSKGREVSTVVAEPISEANAAAEQDRQFNDSTSAIRAIDTLPKPSIAGIAEFCQWHYKDGRPDKSRAQRVVKILLAEKFAIKKLGRLKLTKKGRSEIDS